MGHVIYTPYGGILESTLPPTATHRLFTGQRWDATIGLYDYGNSTGIAGRFYDPETGTFIQPDSIVPDPGNPIAWNRYAYVYNNPANNVDPSGHIPVLLAAAYSVVDTAWDIVDVYSDIRDCLGDSDSMACAMLPIDAMAVVALFAEGPSNNIARRAAKAADVGDAAGDVARRVDDVPAERALFEEFGVTPGEGLNLDTPSSVSGRSYITYEFRDPADGVAYIGRASGPGTPNQVMRQRLAKGHDHFLAGDTYRVIDVQGSLLASQGAEEFFIQGYREQGAILRNAIQALDYSRPARTTKSLDKLDAFFMDLSSRRLR